jgi:hypothetical protein
LQDGFAVGHFRGAHLEHEDRVVRQRLPRLRGRESLRIHVEPSDGIVVVAIRIAEPDVPALIGRRILDLFWARRGDADSEHRGAEKGAGAERVFDVHHVPLNARP